MQRIQTFIDDEIYEDFKEEAEQKNMTLSEYARDILMKRAAVEIVIDFADIDSYVEEIDKLIRKIDAILPTIYRTGKIYEQEAVFLKQQLMQINEKGNEIWRYVTNMRTELYDEVRKQLYRKVSANGYKRRRTPKPKKDGEETWQ